jgi:cation diffusion facilitator family transporter
MHSWQRMVALPRSRAYYGHMLIKSQPGIPASGDHTAADRTVRRVALWGIVVSLALLALTVVIATVSHSLSLTAVAVDSTVDVVAAVVLYLGLRLSERKTAAFPYGLYKIENVLQVAVALLIFIASYEIARQAFAPGRQAPSIGGLIIAGVVVTIVATWAYGWYAMRWGKRVSSPALVADGKHRQTDVLSTSLALVAVVSTSAGVDMDRIAALAILCFAVYAGWGLLISGMKVLLDASVDAGTLAQIERILASEALIEQVESLAVRSAGRYVFLEATLRLRTDDLARAHVAAERLETQIRTALPAVERVSLRLEPRRRDVLLVAVPLASPEGEISDEFGEAPVFGLAEVRTADERVLRQEVVENPHRALEKQKGILVAEWLVGQGIDVLITVRAVNKGPSYVLREAGVEMRLARTARLADELARFPHDGHTDGA